MKAEEIALHPDVKQAYNHLREDNYRMKGAIYAFWANDKEVILNKKDETIVHHGHNTALLYQKLMFDKGKKVCLMENFEGKGPVLNLNDYEKRTDIYPEVLQAVCAMASYSYANSAAGTILTSVKGADPYSFFRTTELDVIMSNKKITHITNISRQDPIGKTYPKKEAYHILRDEWIETAKEKFIISAQEYKADKTFLKQKHYESMLTKLAAEIVNAQTILENEHSFSKNSPCKQNNRLKYTDEDKIRERKRIDNCTILRGQYPDLEIKIKKLQSNTMRQEWYGYTNNLSSLKSILAELKHDLQIIA